MSSKSSNLDLLISRAAAASDLSPVWDDERAGRVLASTLARRERQCTRARIMRRSLVVASAVAVVVFVLLRGAGATTTSTSNSNTSASSHAATESAQDDQQPAILATHELIGANGDGGYGRD